MRGVSVAADRQSSAAPIQSRSDDGHHRDMTYNTSSLPNPSSPERAAPRTEALHSTRATPWEPRGARVSRALIGVAGAALVGGLAIAGVLLTPSRQVPRHPAGDQVAATQAQPAEPATQGQQAATQPQPGMTADQMAAQSQHEPAAAGTSATPATPSTPSADPAQQAQPGSPDETPSPAPKPGSGQ